MSSVYLILRGLNCPHCAGKIEERVNKLQTVEQAVLNFSNQELSIVFHEDTKQRLLEQVRSIIKKLEPDVEVLEKNTHAHEHAHTHEHEEGSIRVKLLRFGIGLALYIAALAVSSRELLRLGLFIAAYLVFGADVIIRAIRNIMRGDVFDENFLMSVSTIGAFCIGEYPEGVAVMLFYQIGEFFQGLAVGKSRKSIRDLMNLKAEYANVVENGQIVMKDPSEVAIGDVIMVKPGEKVPLDGVVLEGKSWTDSSALTGESLPRLVEAGDGIMSGVINRDSVLTIRVDTAYEDSTVAKILEMVEDAGNRKAPTEKFITKFSRIYTPAVVGTAVVLAIIPPLVLPGASFSEWISRALVFLVVSCPCALVISVPLSFFAGIGAAGKRGILIKGSEYLQSLSQIDTVVFDKTGTLTKGVFQVSQVYPVDGVDRETLLSEAYVLERFSNHPIAKSVVKAHSAGAEMPGVETNGFEELGGMGLKGFLNGEMLLAGNSKLMDIYGISLSGRVYTGTGTALYVARGGKYRGCIVISDEIKEDGVSAVAKLRSIGINDIVMLTGDRSEEAERTAGEIGITRVYSQLLPDEKVVRVEELYLENPKRKVVFVGDGINDAPVLARADVGIAMGGVGSDAAIEAADVVIMTDQPSKIAEAIIMAGRTMSIVRQNIAFAIMVKAFVLLLGAIGMANMWMAVFADVGVTLLVVLNSMRRKN